ncbi:fused MFS/spermidine synthase [Anaerolinea sp.]|uniref:spermidine synthase n=1 Tax=Anaerolinea sp. TaxID=1872519 RepID=UPI002ACD2F46|nr:fused MFS/spermidine synthase [Anaerolinea sp.]
MRSSHLYLAVFFSGLTTLSAELAAARLLENHFGTSNLIYATIIGLILIYLTAGYFLGGKWADRSPSPSTFLKILLWGGFFVGLIPLASRPLLQMASRAFDAYQMGALLAAFVVVMILFIIPITLLGMASPFAIRLAIEDPASAGKVAGKIYAISTLGSFIGTFLPGLLLIPALGTYRTFLTIGGMLVIITLLLFLQVYGIKKALLYAWMLVLLVILGILGVRGFDKPTPGLVYETESSYNYIQVVEQNGYRYLRLNEGQGIHSMYHPSELLYAGPWEQVLVAPYLNTPFVEPNSIRSMAIVGLAAGTTARQAVLAYPGIQIDGFELDPKIVEVGQRFFDMQQPGLSVYTQDGRWGLSHSPRKYQIISLDAYRPPYIPWHLTTQEFFQIVREHLTEDGVMVMNVGHVPGDTALIESLCTTLSTVFPSVYVMDLPQTFNSLIYASVQPTTLANLETNWIALLQNRNTSPLILYPMQVMIENIRPATTNGVVFTDDHAPVEWITNEMIIRFFFEGGMEVLQ